jgi:dipeptidyl aminopeptidase/acylaminoacyl peptidase
LLTALAGAAPAADVVSPQDVLRTKLAVTTSIGPDGKWIAYNVRVPREPGDEAGADYRELYVVSAQDGTVRPFITGKVTVNSPAFSPDGRWIAFRMARGEKSKTQVWVIPRGGGEARQVTHSKTNVSTFRWHPDGGHIGYVASTPPTEREEQLKKKGYEFEYYEENLKHRNLYVQPVDGDGEAHQITEDISVWAFEFAPGGGEIAVAASERNLIDHNYMFRNIYLVDTKGGDLRQLSRNEGKLGNFAFNDTGAWLVYAAGRSRSDHAVSQAYVVDVAGGEVRNVTPEDYRGHIDWVAWRNKDTVVYRAAEGVWNSLYTVRVDGKKRKRILEPADAGMVFGQPTFTKDFKYFAMTGSTADDPSNVYVWRPGKTPKRLTNLNPWVADRKLGGQEVIRYAARDGVEIEAILIYPVDYRRGTRYPLIVVVHGGPESHYTNSWQTYYSRPAQVYAGKGYFVFQPNYRSSTGYGVDIAESTLGDPAGKEFDDIADGIDYLVDSELVDGDRVGLGGGSYGGYAAAWFATYYTRYVRAACVFVGISDLISKRSTTDIPYEELYVHSGKKLEEMWELSLERSPIYHAHKSETAVLIYGGASDTRVHPSQSLELYRRLKMNGHPAVRYVRYPGEGHGNAKQPGRTDVLYRAADWYDWYVRDAKPIDGPMPPLDISDYYGLELENDE